MLQRSVQLSIDWPQGATFIDLSSDIETKSCTKGPRSRIRTSKAWESKKPNNDDIPVCDLVMTTSCGRCEHGSPGLELWSMDFFEACSSDLDLAFLSTCVHLNVVVRDLKKVGVSRLLLLQTFCFVYFSGFELSSSFTWAVWSGSALATVDPARIPSPCNEQVWSLAIFACSVSGQVHPWKTRFGKGFHTSIMAVLEENLANSCHRRRLFCSTSF